MNSIIAYTWYFPEAYFSHSSFYIFNPVKQTKMLIKSSSEIYVVLVSLISLNYLNGKKWYFLHHEHLFGYYWFHLWIIIINLNINHFSHTQWSAAYQIPSLRWIGWTIKENQSAMARSHKTLYPLREINIRKGAMGASYKYRCKQRTDNP